MQKKENRFFENLKVYYPLNFARTHRGIEMKDVNKQQVYSTMVCPCN